MFAQLGNIIFDNLKTFGEFTNTGSANYAEHSLLDGKPRLQRTGSSLEDLTIGFRLHAAFCNPEQELAALKTIRDDGEVLPLLWGDGRLEGNFVITQLSATKEEAASDGTALSYTVNLSLKEYVTPNKLQQQQQDSRDNAKAVGDKKPVAKKKKNVSTCPQKVTKIIKAMESRQGAIEDILAKRGGVATNPVNREHVKENVEGIQGLTDNLAAICDDPKSCAAQYPRIKGWNLNVKGSCIELIKQLQAVVFDPSAANKITLENKLLKSRLTALESEAKPLIQQTITRK